MVKIGNIKDRKTMKKIFYFAAAALMFASCAKESIDTPNQESDKVFTASFADEGATRTALQSDGLKLEWQSSDAIAINGQKYAISSISGGTATFAAAGTAAEAVGGKYVSVYPNDAATFAEGALTKVTFPATQTVEAGNFDPAAALMYAESEDTDLKFKNLASILRFELKSEKEIKLKEIIIEANDDDNNEIPLYGDATVDATDADNPVVTMTSTGNNELTINTGADGTQLSSSTATSFSVCLPPAAYGNWEITFTDDDDQEYELYLEGDYTMQRGKVYTIKRTLSSDGGCLTDPIESPVKLQGTYAVDLDAVKTFYFATYSGEETEEAHNNKDNYTVKSDINTMQERPGHLSFGFTSTGVNYSFYCNYNDTDYAEFNTSYIESDFTTHYAGKYYAPTGTYRYYVKCSDVDRLSEVKDIMGDGDMVCSQTGSNLLYAGEMAYWCGLKTAVPAAIDEAIYLDRFGLEDTDYLLYIYKKAGIGESSTIGIYKMSSLPGNQMSVIDVFNYYNSYYSDKPDKLITYTLDKQ